MFFLVLKDYCLVKIILCVKKRKIYIVFYTIKDMVYFTETKPTDHYMLSMPKR